MEHLRLWYALREILIVDFNCDLCSSTDLNEPNFGKRCLMRLHHLRFRK